MIKYELTYRDGDKTVDGTQKFFNSFEEALDHALGDHTNAHAPDHVYLHFEGGSEINAWCGRVATYDREAAAWSLLDDRVVITKIAEDEDRMVSVDAVLCAIFNNQSERGEDLIKCVIDDLRGNGYDEAAKVIPALWARYLS